MLVTELWQYPIKSCAGISVQQANADEEGFTGDRRFQWVLDNGRFVSQREFPRLGLIKAQWHDDQLSISTRERQWLVTQQDFSGERNVTIWNDSLLAESYSGSLNAAVSEMLGVSVTLVRMPERGRSISDPAAEGHVSFADGFPYLLTTMQSLAELNSRLTIPVTMQHFRSNIIIDGEAPYAEDGWSRLAIGDLVFRIVKPCSRCVMTTVNPDTVEKRRDGEPLKTLASYRMTEPGKILFGVNMVVEQAGKCRVGDAVTILE